MPSLNRKITQNKSKHLLIENELSTLENKIPDVSSLREKTDYSTRVAAIDTKISTFDGIITENTNKLKEVAKGSILLFLRYSMLNG